MRPESGERLVEEKQSSDSGKEGGKALQKDEGEKVSVKSDAHTGGHGEEVAINFINRLLNLLLYMSYNV
jgi:hypothetical protein